MNETTFCGAPTPQSDDTPDWARDSSCQWRKGHERHWTTADTDDKAPFEWSDDETPSFGANEHETKRDPMTYFLALIKLDGTYAQFELDVPRPTGSIPMTADGTPIEVVNGIEQTKVGFVLDTPQWRDMGRPSTLKIEVTAQ